MLYLIDMLSKLLNMSIKFLCRMTSMTDDISKLTQTARSLPIALLRARETVMEPFREMLGVSGISEQKWRVLRVVSESGPTEQTAIASAACLMLPSLTRILTAMEKDGLLRRQPDTQDRRKSIVTLLPKGQALIKDHASRSANITADLQDRFGAEKMERLLDLLQELHELDLTPR
jgi:homoprotocatechuate degradation regulator HpaR